MSPKNRNSDKDPVPKGDRSWALRSFFFASLLWIAGVSVAALYLDKPMENPSRLALIVYVAVLACLTALAMTAWGYAIASLVMRRRGRKIAWAGMLMAIPPFLWCVFLLIKLVLERFS